MISFAVDDETAEDLTWALALVDDEILPIEQLVVSPFDQNDPVRNALIPPLQDAVKARGLWATHLAPELGGRGFDQVELALLNEVLGRSLFAPVVFGSTAPDTGNAEILVHYGSPEQQARYLGPLVDGLIYSGFSMTEPQGGSDPEQFTTVAQRDGDEWVIDGEKWFTSNARYASFLIVMAVTDPDGPRHHRHSMFIVPLPTSGVSILRNVGVAGWDAAGEGSHGYIRFEGARVPADHLLGEPGEAFAVAQRRLGGGRVHHAMRAVGMARRAFELLCERAVSRWTRGEPLARKQLVQEMVADSWIELEQLRLLVLQTAWKIDQRGSYNAVRADVAAVKAAMPGVLRNIASRALQIHGSLGISDEMPFVSMVVNAFHLALADGPTEVHKVTLAARRPRSLHARARAVPEPSPAGVAGSRRIEASRRASSQPRRTVIPSSDEVKPVGSSDALDWGALECHLRDRLVLPEATMKVGRFAHGNANLTYELRFGATRYVLRRPPFGTLPPGAHDVGREHRVLAALCVAYPRAPRPLLFCEDDRVIGSPFLVEEYREGVTIRETVPESLAREPNAATRASLALVDAMSELHSVDAGLLGDAARGLTFVDRQLAGWADRWQRCRHVHPVPSVDALGRRLRSRVPRTQRAAVTHNDLKLDNCQFAPGDPDHVTTVLDWEMATVGDPLADLGTLLSYWATTIAELQLPVAAPRRLSERYAERTGLDLERLDWYTAFAGWRTAIAVQQLLERRLEASPTDGAARHDARRVDDFAEHALSVLG